ncbi:MAG: EAL domain-containing protein [Firmicutes bacterium]|nr:EAL domain-containing protein [Bacillota bacterium]
MDPARLHIEVTENAVMEDFEQVQKILQKLKGLGVKIALDDFGTGFTSLAVLQQLPVDIVKIDRTFIQGLGQNEKDRAIVHAIITMAAALGLEVTAEGVEAEEVLPLLASMKCDHAQCYILSKPLPEVELLGLLGRQEERK